MAEYALWWPSVAGEGLRAVCIREVQKSLKESAKRLIEDTLTKYGLGEADGFRIFQDRIETPRDGLVIFTGMQDHTAESIKSLEGYHIAWIEEAQTITERSLALLRPTIRWEDKKLDLASQIWASWNPRRKVDPIDQLLRGEEKPSNAVVVEANWRDNPWFPDVLEQERQDCLRLTPELYDHIWEGGYATITAGAYYAKQLADAKKHNRIGRFPMDPLIRTLAIFDIGGTGRKSDATAIGIFQFKQGSIHALNYRETVGQPLSSHVGWMHQNDYQPGNTRCILPHDGDTNDKVYDVSYMSALEDAGYDVEVVPNQGRGAAMNRIDALRRVFHRILWNDRETEPLRDALGWYHERIDEERQVGLGPEHDWSSHGADMAGLMAVIYEEEPISRDLAQISDAYQASV